MTITKTAFLAVAMILSGLSASAQEVPVLDGCTPVATILKASCAATTIQRCASRTVNDTYIRGKRVDRHIFDDQWGIAGYSAHDDTMVIKVDRMASDRSSLDELLKNGNALAVKNGTWSTGIIKNRPFVMDEIYTMTDETVLISDIRFRKGQVTRVFKIHPQKRDLDGIWKFDVYLSQDASLFFEGRGSVTRNGRHDVLDYQPLEIALPGQPGFLADRSGFGCE